MKKFFAGLIVGMVLATSLTVYASTRLTAEVVNFKYVVNGKSVTPNGISLVANGRSYLPVRALGEVMGYNVGYNDQTNTIFLDSKKEVKSLEMRDTERWEYFYNGIQRDMGGFAYPAFKGDELFIRITGVVILLGINQTEVVWNDATLTLSFPFDGKHVKVDPSGIYLDNHRQSTNGLVNHGFRWVPVKELVEALGGTYQQGDKVVSITIE